MIVQNLTKWDTGMNLKMTNLKKDFPSFETIKTSLVYTTTTTTTHYI